MFLTDDHAKLNVVHGLVGSKYRPANGTEGDIFYSYYCENCTVCDECEIREKTLIYSEEDESYPIEWQYNQLGQPTCTAYIYD